MSVNRFVSQHFLTGAPYDCIVASLGVHTLVGHGATGEIAVSMYEKAFKLILSALKPGGHFIYGDHVGVLPLYRHSSDIVAKECLKLNFHALSPCTIVHLFIYSSCFLRQLRIMEDVGFCEIDVSWRQEAFFVAGGRRKAE